MISDARSFSSLTPTDNLLWLRIAILYSYYGYLSTLVRDGRAGHNRSEGEHDNHSRRRECLRDRPVGVAVLTSAPVAKREHNEQRCADGSHAGFRWILHSNCRSRRIIALIRLSRRISVRLSRIQRIPVRVAAASHGNHTIPLHRRTRNVQLVRRWRHRGPRGGHRARGL